MDVVSFNLIPSQTSALCLVPTTSIEAKKLENDRSASYIKIHEKHEISHAQFPLKIEEEWTSTPFLETFVLTLKKGRLLGVDGVVITPENRVLRECARWTNPVEKLEVFQMTALPLLKRVNDRVAVLASHAGNNYYHWMFEILPRLELLKQANRSFDKVYLPKIQYPFQRETLQTLNIRPDQWIEADQTSYIEAEEVIFPSLPNRACCTHPLWVCNFLKQTFLPGSSPPPPSEKIYISRKTTTDETSSRRIVNEEDVLTFLQSRGFRKVVLEELSVSAQAQLFSSAQMVVAAHGAGLSNLVFCQSRKVKVFEIFRPEHLDETYFFLSDQLGFEHHCLLASSENLTSTQKAQGALYVPIELLRKALDGHQE